MEDQSTAAEGTSASLGDTVRPRLCQTSQPPFQRLIGLAARSLGVERAFLVFVPKWRLGGAHGLQRLEAKKFADLVSMAVESNDTVWIEDAAVDIRCGRHLWHRGDSGTRFAAATQLKTTSGSVIAVLCILGDSPRPVSEQDRLMLEDFGQLALNEWHLRLSAIRRAEEVDCCKHAQRMSSAFAGDRVVPFELRMHTDGSFHFAMVAGSSETVFGIRPGAKKTDVHAVTDRIHPDDRTPFETTLRVSADTLEPWVWEGRVESVLGLTEWLHVSSKPRRDRGGVIVWHGAFVKVTEHKQAEIAYRNAYLWLEQAVHERTHALRQSQSEMLLRLGRAAEYRDGETGAHIARMSRYCAAIGRQLGLPEEECELLMNASTMHDIGKIGVPDAVLLKAGGLDGEEWRKMKAHVEIGSELLSGGNSKLVKAAEIIARTHHEKWDGNGYPSGLCGKEIPLYGRIAAIADVFDALTSERPYKPAWTPDEAVEEIRSQAGRHFDPAIVEVFVAALPEILDIMRRCQSDDAAFAAAA